MFSFKPSFVLAALLVSVLAIPAPNPGAQPFTQQNGQDAIDLNNKFQGLTAGSPCSAGDQACITSKFAQCVAGNFVLTDCAAGTQCFALPLVNKQGTSITCTTVADKDARIQATGASGGGSSNNAADAGSSSPVAAAAAAPSPAAPAPAGDSGSGSPGSKPFTLQNGKDAQALNAKFAGLTPSSPCTSGQNACINNQFAQCVNGQFVMTGCAGGLQCAALPLVNSPGTSITCVDNAQALARFAASGAGASLTGN